ncbi:MAG: molybdenum cofactor guanylyltransferase [bacterium JZ-2024 1]
MEEERAVLLLCGGKSKRFGSDKKWALFQGKPLLFWMLEKAYPLAAKERIFCLTSEPIANLPVPVVVDAEPYPGPLHAFFFCARILPFSHYLLLPVDMPLLPISFLTFLWGHIPTSFAIVPRWKGKIEPLIALYPRELTKVYPTEKKSFQEWILLLERHNKVQWIEEEEIISFGEPEQIFWNINRVQDLEQAEKIWKERQLKI